MIKRLGISAAALAAVAAAPASAATLVSLDRASYDALYGGASVQDFDSLTDGAVLVDDGFIAYSTTGGSALVTSTFVVSSSPNGLGATNVGFFGSADTLTLTFDAAINFFGIDINTFATADGAYSAILNTGDDAFSVFDPFAGQSTGQFLGFFSDTAFTSLTLTPVGGVGDVYTVDTIQYGAVPEPGVWLMMLIGFFGIGGAMRYRRRDQQVTVSYS